MVKKIIIIIVSLISILDAQEVLNFDIGDWEPFTSSRDSNSRILELLVKEVFEIYDIRVEYSYYPWLRCLRNIENGSSDGSFPLMRTPERDINTFASKEPILVEDNVFFHLKDLQFDWKDYDDLLDYRIGGTIG